MTHTSSNVGELTLDQQVEQEGKVFGSPEAGKLENAELQSSFRAHRR